jgi:hypothetical protein
VVKNKSLFVLAEQHIALSEIRGLGIEWSDASAKEIINETIIALDDKILSAFDTAWDNTADGNRYYKGFYRGRYLQNENICCFRGIGMDREPFIYCRKRVGAPMQTVREISEWLRNNGIDELD